MKKTRVLPRAAAARQVAPLKEGTRPKEDRGKGQHPGVTAEVARVAGGTAAGQARGTADAGTGRDGEVHGRPIARPKI